MNIDFSGKVALVTGGAGGIGRSICLEFSRSGAKVCCVDLDKDEGTKTVELIKQEKGDAIFVQADVSDSKSVQNYVRETLDAYGRIDAFANNAAYQGRVLPTVDYPEEVFDRVMNTNVKGVFLGLKYVLPTMIKQGYGAVINTGSTASHAGAIGVSAYTASKHAILGLTRSAALEVAGNGVRVNCICPGGTNTQMLRALMSERSQNEKLTFDTGSPNGRAAEPEEIAANVVFLASDYASHMIGQSIIIDGGRLAM